MKRADLVAEDRWEEIRDDVEQPEDDGHCSEQRRRMAADMERELMKIQKEMLGEKTEKHYEY